MTAFTRIAIGSMFATALGLAQAGGTAAPAAPAAPPSTPAPTTPTTGGGGNSPTPIIVPQGSSQQSQSTAPVPQQPIFISGAVTMADGTEPPERVLIERVCSTNKVRAEGYTDSKGRFSFQLGGSLQLVPDASQSLFFDGTQGLSQSPSAGSNTSSNQAPGDPFFDCEIRARLPGHRSSSLLLAGHKSMDNPNIGTLVLYPMLQTDGQAVSATSATASKDARKAFDKGMNEARKQKFESAEKEFRKAVTLHPKYADGWLELGKTYMALKRLPEAREAINQAIAADPQYVYPYEQLYQISFEEANWKELADTTDRLLRLNPYDFPGAYYFHGVAEYQLKNYDSAQKSLQQAIDADRRNRNPKAHYVLGLVLVQKHDYPAAAESFVTFANLAPNDPQIPKVQSLLEQIEKVLR
jgi:tetratricopeptide (TPR) repeat protein